MDSPSKLELIPDDDPRLREKCDIINIYNEPDLRAVIEEMFQLMLKNNGMGLAAPQVGIKKRFFIMFYDNKMYVCINPSIKKYGRETETSTEGCLSFPNLTLNIERPTMVKVAYQDIRGQRVEKKFTGVLARCFLHEYDHLNGIVFTEKLLKQKA